MSPIWSVCDLVETKAGTQGQWKWWIDSFVVGQQKQGKWNVFIGNWFSIDVLVFIRFLWESKYPLYIASLPKFIRWYFALDCYNYARWLLVHIYDMLPLPQNSPQLHKSFMDGCFTFQKSISKIFQFSLMGLDQIHKQNNAVMKVMGGAISILNKADESSLDGVFVSMNWHLLSMNTNLKRMIWIVRTSHNNNGAFQKHFTTDFNCLGKAVISNSFMLEKLTVLNNHDKAKFNDRVFEDIKSLKQKGKNNSFISGRKDWSQLNYQLMFLSR